MEVIVSVVIPVYNREKLIKNSVESVLNQTFKNIEVIVVDDCSADGTVDVLRAIKDDRLKYYCNSRNQGANYSRNYGISKSVGKYIAFHDSDDIWEENKLEIFVKTIEQKNCDVVFSGMTKYGKGYKRYLPTYNLNEFNNKYRQLLLQNCVSTQNLITSGQNQWDFIDYDEFCVQTAKTVEQTKVDGIINICSGHPEKLSERVERFIAENGYKIKLAYGTFPDRPYDSKAVWGNDEKIRKILGN